MYSVYKLITTPTPFYMPKRIVFEVSGALKLHNELQLVGVEKGSKIFLVLDPALKGLEHVIKTVKGLEENGYVVDTYTDVEYEPSIECLRRAVEYIRKDDFKAVIGIGGGSTLDIAKVSAAAKDNPGRDVEEFIGMDKIPKRLTPVIALPTTAGTASEVSRYTVFTRGVGKVGINGYNVLPDIAVVDPVFTYTLPPKITAGTGLDALSHAVEGMISLDASPMSDALGFLSIELVFKYLRRAYYKGSDTEARYFMSLAATSAGAPLNIGRAILGHSISQTFGPQFKVHHGTACGMVLPYIMEFYLTAVPEKLAAMAKAAGIDTTKLKVREAAEEAVKAAWKLLEDLDIPLSLRDIGVSKAELETLAERSVKEWPRPNSPIELTKERVLKVIEAMYEGRLMKIKN